MQQAEQLAPLIKAQQNSVKSASESGPDTRNRLGRSPAGQGYMLGTPRYGKPFSRSSCGFRPVGGTLPWLSHPKRML